MSLFQRLLSLGADALDTARPQAIPRFADSAGPAGLEEVADEIVVSRGASVFDAQRRDDLGVTLSTPRPERAFAPRLPTPMSPEYTSRPPNAVPLAQHGVAAVGEIQPLASPPAALVRSLESPTNRRTPPPVAPEPSERVDGAQRRTRSVEPEVAPAPLGVSPPRLDGRPSRAAPLAPPIAAAEPTVEIEIGRIEIRTARPPAAAPRPRVEPMRPRMSVTDYLDRRRR